jgi:hypothetical protein
MHFRVIATSCVAALIANSAMAVSAPKARAHHSGKSAASTAAPTAGPTLADTLEFIRARLSQEGKISYAGFMHDGSDNSDWVNQFVIEASGVTADSAACQLNYHWTTSVDGVQKQDFDAAFHFTYLDHVALTSMEEDVNRLSANAGHATWVGRVNPSIWVVTAFGPDGAHNVIDFRDAEVAGRVVKAIDHAIDLCGGKKHQVF